MRIPLSALIVFAAIGGGHIVCCICRLSSLFKRQCENFSFVPWRRSFGSLSFILLCSIPMAKKTKLVMSVDELKEMIVPLAQSIMAPYLEQMLTMQQQLFEKMLELHKEMLVKIAANQFPVPAADAALMAEGEIMRQHSAMLSQVEKSAVETGQDHVISATTAVNETAKVIPKGIFHMGEHDKKKSRSIKVTSGNVRNAAEVVRSARRLGDPSHFERFP